MLRVKTVEALPRPMTPEVYAALLGELRTRRDRALLEVMWEGGLRPGEVLGLRLEDLSYGQRRVAVRKRDDHPRQVRQKSRRDRVVDLLEGRALPALNDYVMRSGPPTPTALGCSWSAAGASGAASRWATTPWCACSPALPAGPGSGTPG